MPRRRRRVSRLSLFYFVVTLGLLVGGSIWLDRRGEVTTARVASKHEEITVQQVPVGGWIRWYRVGVEFDTRDAGRGMATVTLPQPRYDGLHPGDTIQIRYLPFFPLLARAADRSTGQAALDVAGHFANDPWLLPFLFWLLGGFVALWIASRVATVAIVVAGLAGMAWRSPWSSQPPGSSRPLPRRHRAVTAVTLVTKAPARTTPRRSRVGLGTSESVRRLAMPYEVVQLQFAPPGLPDSVVAVDVVDSASVAGLTAGAIVPIAYDPRSPRTPG